MKKNLFICLCVLVCVCCLSSCSFSALECMPDDINMNYNNIRNRNGYWLTSDSVCYLSSSLFPTYYCVNKSSRINLGMSGGYGTGSVQRYRNKIYILNQTDFVDERNSVFELKLYDIDSAKTTFLFSINNCEKFLVLDEDIYYSEYNWTNHTRVSTLKRYCIDSNEHEILGEQVLSFGVIDNNVFYLAEENGQIVVSQYNDETKSSIVKGAFSLGAEEIYNLKEYGEVSYTSSYLLFTITDYETEISNVVKYSFESNSLTSIKLDGYSNVFVAYNTCSYFIVYNEDADISELYKLNNNTDEITRLQKISGQCGLFVGSDNGVYVYEHNDCILNYYSDKANSRPTIVYRF